MWFVVTQEQSFTFQTNNFIHKVIHRFYHTLFIFNNADKSSAVSLSPWREFGRIREDLLTNWLTRQLVATSHRKIWQGQPAVRPNWPAWLALDEHYKLEFHWEEISLLFSADWRFTDNNSGISDDFFNNPQMYWCDYSTFAEWVHAL